jgi:hypothetical protein
MFNEGTLKFFAGDGRGAFLHYDNAPGVIRDPRGLGKAQSRSES